MFGRSHEGQGIWREILSQIPRSVYTLSIELFLACVILSYSRFVAPYYLLLFTLYIPWIYYTKTSYQQLQLAIFIILCALLIGMPRPFKAHQIGMVTYTNPSGFQVGHVFYDNYHSTFKEGDIVDIKGYETVPRTRLNPGSFDYENYLKGKGILYHSYVDEVTKIGALPSLKIWVDQLLSRYVKSELQPYYRYFLFAQSQAELKDFSQMAIDVGILHLFCVSGMHFTLLADSLEKFLKHLLPKRFAQVIVTMVLSAYALILHGKAAAWRAYLMYLFKQYTKLTPYQAYGCAGLLLMFSNPMISLSEGFIYSFVLYLIVLLTTNHQQSHLILFLASIGLVVYHQYQFSVLGFIFAFFFQEIVSFLFSLSLLDILSFGHLGFGLWRLYQGLENLLIYIQRFNLVVTVGKPPIGLVILYELLLLVSIVEMKFYHRRHWWLGFMFSLMMLFTWNYGNPFGSVNILYVGQGDGSLITLPFHQGAIFIDTGGLQDRDIATEVLIPALHYYGYDDVEAVMVSHSDFDHCGALPSLQEHCQVKQVLDDFDTFHIGNLTFTQINDFKNGNINDESQVIAVQLGDSSFLFCGDISTTTEDYLVNTKTLPKIDVIKVAHHGSLSSSSSQFIASISPKYALISCGYHNIYHHPASQVVANYESFGCEVHRTDQEGNLLFLFTKHQTYFIQSKGS